jgi:hypothetical protein
MTISPTGSDLSYDQPFDAGTHDVVCLVKRQTYELTFAVPHIPQALAWGAGLRLLIRVKQPCQAGGFVLNLEDVQSFYEDLLQMIAYLQSERQRIGT